MVLNEVFYFCLTYTYVVVTEYVWRNYTFYGSKSDKLNEYKIMTI